MFINISWSSYFDFVAFILVAYYLFIIFRFYRSDIGHFLTPRSSEETERTFSSHKEKLQEAFEAQDHFQYASSLSDEIRAFLRAGTCDKDIILQSLKVLLVKYPSIKDSSFKEMIQNLILTECETNSSIHLSEEELRELW